MICVRLKMRIIEIFKVIGTILSGFILFLLQRWLLSTGGWGLIKVVTMSRQEYTDNYFTPGAVIVLIMSTLCAILWYAIASKWSLHFSPIKEMTSARLMWVGLSLPPVLSVVVMALWFGNASPTVFPWMLLFLVIDMLVVYWLTTVLATPEEMIPAVFGANWFRG
jgi:hypothetical protein